MEPRITFPVVGAYECDAPGCGCPYGHFRFESGEYDDGTEFLTVYLSCEWGHLTILNLNNHDGAIVFGVDRHEQEG